MGQYNIDTKKYLTNNDTLFEHMMLANIDGKPSGLSTGTSFDSFSRLRTSAPLTLFDSSHRYDDNGLWATYTSGATAAATFNSNQGLIDMTVGQVSGEKVYRETFKAFSYQPGKSLVVFNTFVLGTAKAGLRQRVGYFGTENGIYLERDGTTAYFVKRTNVGGSVEDIRVAQSDWNVDTLDGSTISEVTLDLSKAHILWMDFEWLGAGTVRMGFVINGNFIHCHSFHHANVISSTYITTAMLPLRYEIENTAGTASGSTLKQVCSTVISEGGYELRGAQLAVGTAITSPKSLTTAGTYYPVVTIRLKSTRLDAVVILTALSIMGVGTGIYNWQVIAGSTTSGGSGTWLSINADSSVEYKLDATTITGGRTLASGFLTSNAQGTSTIDVLKEALFKFQLERNTFTSTPIELTLAVSASTDTELVYGSMDWEEVTR